tara:strand:+ start:234 stop:437 length:204 start_codon:yes stop_codon:yes gene_type:complete
MSQNLKNDQKFGKNGLTIKNILLEKLVFLLCFMVRDKKSIKFGFFEFLFLVAHFKNGHFKNVQFQKN